MSSSNDPSARRLLPQNSSQSSQMGSFSFAPPVYQQPRETQKNYVFVDEHNRHKRLKVMRACEGCRRRKIKCDAATTNTWPCSACIRLKLHCVRPNGYEGAAEPQVFETPRPQFDAPQIQDGFRQQLPLHDQQLLASAQKPSNAIYASSSSYAEAPGLYPSVQYSEPQPVPHALQYAGVPQAPLHVVDQSYAPQNAFPTPPLQQGPSSETAPDAFSPDGGYGQIADLLGALKVNEAGTAPYLNNKLRPKPRAGEDEPTVDDADEYMPPLSVGPGSKIRIPPELMPPDETVLHYFDLYFMHVHPYVPVLDKPHFYQQWQTNRESVSPLLLEAIFSVAERLADEAAQGQSWLALASRHADSFMDVPRLSTLQAQLIILKAREQAPKRGYFYRSWMNIVQCVQMAKDLGLDEHYADHQAGKPCDSTPSECALRTRIWQTLFLCEVMIGGPQGRTDLQVEIESVDFGIPRSSPNGDESEYHVSRNFVFLCRVARNIARMTMVYSRVKKQKDWGMDPAFVHIDSQVSAWLNDIPPDLSVNYPPDGSVPWIASSFIGNLHTYHHLSIILLHRPKLSFLDSAGTDGQWKHHMMVSYDAAKMLCRLQEAVLHSFGLPGLQCMQRGISFTIYGVLACLVLHLVALTSPDPDLNTDAREFFTRHMRVLETIMGSWPMPEMQRQIDSVREAFSADTRKPFVLKSSFPYGSPQSATHPSPPRSAYRPEIIARADSMDQQIADARSVQQHSQVSYTNHPITPPISAGPVENKGGSPGLHTIGTLSSNQGSQPPAMAQTLPLADGQSWNPSRIFDQWNTQFGTPSVQTPPESLSQASSLSVTTPGASEVPTVQDIQAVQAQLPPGAPRIPYTAAPAQSFVTPTMWQESVVSVYESAGYKRTWDYDASMGIKRPR